MDWIPITEQPLPKDGKNIMVTIQRNNTAYTSIIMWICSYCDSIPEGWYYADSCDEYIGVSSEEISLITAWMYYPAPYKG